MPCSAGSRCAPVIAAALNARQHLCNHRTEVAGHRGMVCEHGAVCRARNLGINERHCGAAPRAAAVAALGPVVWARGRSPVGAGRRCGGGEQHGVVCMSAERSLSAWTLGSAGHRGGGPPHAAAAPSPGVAWARPRRSGCRARSPAPGQHAPKPAVPRPGGTQSYWSHAARQNTAKRAWAAAAGLRRRACQTRAGPAGGHGASRFTNRPITLWDVRYKLADPPRSRG